MNRQSKHLMGLIAIILITIPIVVGFYLFGREQIIPPQRGITYHGDTIDIINNREGHLTLVSFWASTCKPCIKELPEFIAIHNDYRNKPFSIIGISMPHDQADLSVAIIRHFRLPWPNVPDIQGRHVAAFGDIRAIPTTMLVDHAGVVKWKHEGPVNFQTLRRQLDQHLSQPG